MRVLVTTLGSPSHGRAQLPLVRALAAGGHTVQVVTTPIIASVFAREDVRVAALLPDVMPGYREVPRLQALAAREDLDEEQRAQQMKELMVSGLSRSMALDLRRVLLPVVEDFAPDLILRDGMDLGSVLIGEARGIPQLPTPSGASNSLDPADLLPGLNASRTEQGLPVREDPLSIVPFGRIDCVPEAYSFAQFLPGARTYRQALAVDRALALPDWVAQLPTDRPLVFASIGTAAPLMLQWGLETDSGAMPLPMPHPEESLRTILRAAALLEECTVLVTSMGLTVDVADLPSHVRVTERLPQPLLLETVDLFLTHGGFNSVRESMRTGTPMAVLPQFGDQHPNAQRVEELGLGRHVADATPQGIADTCRAVLADRTIAAGVRRAHLAMLALPDIEHAVADLVELVG
ncbi:glycosyltransferase [Streptomyces sp. NPDC049906]|uniref:glycosyltransferase n=1 Tax=Streptomyces sp. NPDC049906 TaxID=3155656 RepID=UPI00344515E5